MPSRRQTRAPNLPAIGFFGAVSAGYFRQVLLGVRAWCAQHPGTPLNIMSIDGSLPTALSRLRLLGIVGQFTAESVVEQARQFSPHLVGISNRAVLPGLPQVITDDVAVGRMGAEYLLARGLRRLVFLGGSDLHFSADRAAGFCQVSAAAGVRPVVIERKDPQAVAAILAQPRPVGVMCAADLFARNLLEALNLSAVDIPRDLAVLGVDDDPLENALSPVALSSIQLAGEMVGYQAAEAVARLARSQRVKFPVLIPPVGVVSRHSTNVFAVTDPMLERALRLMRERPAELRLAQDLVAALKVPRRTLEWRFRRATGRSVYAELTRSHIEVARQLLGATDLPIGIIAERARLLRAAPAVACLSTRDGRDAQRLPTRHPPRLSGGKSL
jgi:LacI family transcriptional regulator